MMDLVAEFRLSVRRLVRQPGFLVPAVLTLGVGIGIAASVFALVEGILLRPLPYPDADRLVAIRHVAPGTELRFDGVSPGIFLHYRDHNRTFDAVGAYDEASFTLTDGGTTERVRGAAVSPEVFAVIGTEPLLGRLPEASDYRFEGAAGGGTSGVLLGYDLWVRRYGADRDVIGRVIELDGNPWGVVTGVARPGFSFPDGGTDLWIATPQDGLPWSTVAAVREGLVLGVVARLARGRTRADAAADLDRLVNMLPDAFPDVTPESIREQGLRAVVLPFRDEIVGDVRTALLLVLASGGFLLLVTWANVTNLLLLRTHRRRVEIGIARALGATELRVARHLLVECLILSAAGGLLGLGLADLGIQTRFGFAPDQLPRLEGVGMNGIVIGVVAALVFASGGLMGMLCHVGTRRRAAAPALAALRSRSATEGREGQTGRRVLVALQMAVALTLLVGSGLMVRTFWQLRNVDTGFEAAGRLSLYVPTTHLEYRADYHQHARLYERIFERLRALPGVLSVDAATTSVFPLTVPEGGHLAPVTRANAAAPAGDASLNALYGFATPGYFEAMGIPLVAGRTFRPEDTAAGSTGVILSRRLARELFGGEDALGRQVEFEGWGWTSFTVIGIVGDVPGTMLRQGGSRAIYLPHVYPPASIDITGTLFQYTPRFETVVIRSDRDPAALAAAVRRAIAEVDPRIPVLDVATLEEIVAGATAGERVIMRLILASAGAALFLGVVGIYGVLAYSVRRRGAEIAIRIALGATPRHVTALIVAQGLIVCGAGIAAGLLAALGLTRSMASILYETSPTDPATFAATTLLLFAVALLASWIPARRASRTDPAVALRAE